MVLAPFKLRCCDMDSGTRLQELQRKRAGTLSVDQNFSNGDHKFVESDSCVAARSTAEQSVVAHYQSTMCVALFSYNWLLSTTYVPEVVSW
jgi:hypothetical protein